MMRESKFWIPVALAALAASAAWTRLRGLGHAAFGSDYMEFYRWVLMERPIADLWKNPPWMNQIPLNETLPLLLVKLGLPPTPFVVRLPFALMGLLALFFMARFAWKRFGPASSASVLLLGVFNPFYLFFSRTSYYYAGAACWSAAMFAAFWTPAADLVSSKRPRGRSLLWWFAAAVIACHMHMSVWVVTGLQAVLLLGLGLRGLRRAPSERHRFLVHFAIGAVALAAFMSRWVFRAVSEVLKISSGEGQHIGSESSREFLRLLPAFFAGERAVAVVLLLVFLALCAAALVRPHADRGRYRALFGLAALHLLALMLYIAFIGGGIAKISYFSPVWPLLILALGVGAERGAHALCAGRPVPRAALTAAALGAYLALTAPAARAIMALNGKLSPYYAVIHWSNANLPDGTPVLVDRWLTSWNQLAVHGPVDVAYTFPVPTGPEHPQWKVFRADFFRRYPGAAMLKLASSPVEDAAGVWDFLDETFARKVSFTNAAARTMRRLQVYPTVKYRADTHDFSVAEIYYNTTEDLVRAARAAGRPTLRLYGDGWGFAKPGWRQGHFEDYRVLGKQAAVSLFNLTEKPVRGRLVVEAATADRPKIARVAGRALSFSPNRVTRQDAALDLQPGENVISLTSPDSTPLFVRDLRWEPGS
jgi:hypothetical protein